MSRVAPRSAETVSVLVSMGSNIEPRQNLAGAVELLARATVVKAASRVFATKAVTEHPTPDYLNVALEIHTRLPPAELKYGLLREVEARLGRCRSADKNAPRPIDLDIALYADTVLDNEPLGLVVPDPEILSRAHVVVPLADLAPEREHPVTGDCLSLIASRFAGDGLTVRPASDCDFLAKSLR